MMGISLNLSIFISGSGGTGKFHLVKNIYRPISKTLLYHCKENEKPRFLLLGPTGISAVNILETIIIVSTVSWITVSWSK